MIHSEEQLEKRVQRYNRIYFNNSIKQPIKVKWSRKLFNSGSMKSGYANDHTIVLNVSLSDASEEVLRNVLLHEMIHVWQFEHDPQLHDDFSTLNGHTKAFDDHCDRINKHYSLTYPLQRYNDEKVANSLLKYASCYYVYKYTTSATDESVKYPIGVFVKFLYADEVNRLKQHGLFVKYYKSAKFSDTYEFIEVRNKYIAYADNEFFVPYARIKNCTADNFVKTIAEQLGRKYLFDDSDFNYESGIEVA